MFLPDALAGRCIAIAGPAGPLAEAVADAAGRAGAAVVLCGQNVDSLDELAWDLAERRDAPVDIVAWDGEDVGAGLRAALERAGHDTVDLVLLGAAGWTPHSAAAWAGRRVVVMAQSLPQGAWAAPQGADGGVVVLAAPDALAEVDLAAWAVFLLTSAGRHGAGQAITLTVRG